MVNLGQNAGKRQDLQCLLAIAAAFMADVPKYSTKNAHAQRRKAKRAGSTWEKSMAKTLADVSACSALNDCWRGPGHIAGPTQVANLPGALHWPLPAPLRIALAAAAA